ncbi:hypothetical protein HZA96_06680 [Candidatus Woesearchaeota archaeon]|nr:hypothetical protein [Candidatus Woesearchaeota archaeon]
MFRRIWQAIKKGFLAFSHFMQKVVNTILLTIVYFVGVGLTSLISKLFGKHYMELKLDKDAKSYYKECMSTKKVKEEFYRMY